ncbi:hypothetical protein V6439_004530 [Vibrio parahaemolyticus]
MIVKRLEYKGAVFIDNTESQLLSAGIPSNVVSQALNQAKFDAANESRRAAYSKEADPLYMEWQYDQTPEKEQAWRDKVAEIKVRIPLPSEY